MMKFLLTGFEPFGQSKINPSEQGVRALAGEQFAEFVVETAVSTILHTLYAHLQSAEY
jgi:pyrrolidone-carboxylate peptidase